MVKTLATLLASAVLLWGACAHAQEQPLSGPNQSAHRFVRGLDAIVAQSAGNTGVTIVGLFDKPGAAPSPLLPLDILLRVGQRPITSIADVVEAIASMMPSTSFEVVVRRGDQERTLQLTLAR